MPFCRPTVNCCYSHTLYLHPSSCHFGIFHSLFHILSSFATFIFFAFCFPFSLLRRSCFFFLGFPRHFCVFLILSFVPYYFSAVSLHLFSFSSMNNSCMSRQCFGSALVSMGIHIQHFRSMRIKKCTVENIYILFLTAIYLFLGLHKGRQATVEALRP